MIHYFEYIKENNNLDRCVLYATKEGMLPKDKRELCPYVQGEECYSLNEEDLQNIFGEDYYGLYDIYEYRDSEYYPTGITIHTYYRNPKEIVPVYASDEKDTQIVLDSLIPAEIGEIIVNTDSGYKTNILINGRVSISNSINTDIYNKADIIINTVNGALENVSNVSMQQISNYHIRIVWDYTKEVLWRQYEVFYMITVSNSEKITKENLTSQNSITTYDNYVDICLPEGIVGEYIQFIIIPSNYKSRMKIEDVTQYIFNVSINSKLDDEDVKRYMVNVVNNSLGYRTTTSPGHYEIGDIYRKNLQ